MDYIQVILPLKLEWVPFYCTEQRVEPGEMVRVNFSGRTYLGVVWRCGISPKIYKSRIQNISSVEQGLPRISSKELKLWEFIADYYMCTLGEVYKAAYPVMKLRSEQTAVTILERLRTKLLKTEESLKGRHSERVRQRLEAEKEETLKRIEKIESSNSTPFTPLAAGKPILLRGSERSHHYRQEVRKALEHGGQVLMLCPETAFCTKMAAEMEEFSDFMHLVHAEQTPARKRAAAEALRKGEAALIIGARSAIFLPFSRLALVIIDNEQDASFKQSEPAPRYNGRDCAVYLASLRSSQVILGSSWPSLESIHNCINGKYTLQEIANEKQFCEIIDISAEKRKNGMIGAFSRKAIEIIHQSQGRIQIIRGWEKEDELTQTVRQIFPGRDVNISRLSEFKHEASHDAAVCLVLQADALISKDDFRGDERALQIMALISSICPLLIVQTSVPKRFDPSRRCEELLKERQDFSFPPYTRLIEKKRKGSGECLQRFFLAKDSSLASAKARIAENLEEWCYLDVDPQ